MLMESAIQSWKPSYPKKKSSLPTSGVPRFLVFQLAIKAEGVTFQMASCCFELCFPAHTPFYIFLFMLIARCSYIIALTEEGCRVGGPCSFYYLLFSMFLYIIFIWIGVSPNPSHIPNIIIMHVACAAAKAENNIYLFQPFSLGGFWNGGDIDPL